ncbi:MAG: RidA family protein [Aggregatilineales bacterium]
MTQVYNNPFPPESDRHILWHMLVERDIEAFLKGDWSMVEDDFLAEGFIGMDGSKSDNPDNWRLDFPSVTTYRDTWLKQSREMLGKVNVDTLRSGLIDATYLRDIEIKDGAAVLHKKFNGQIVADDGEIISLQWQTLYYCKMFEGRWKITGFTGYLPYPMGTRGAQPPTQIKQSPAGASQHITAGPYSPVLIVNPGQLVVISGQAAIDQTGMIVGDTIEEQTRVTMENCLKQLASAGCNFANVFKANVYLTDLAHWNIFNSIYVEFMPEPRPVRTAVQAQLLPGLLVEVEMWAVKA